MAQKDAFSPPERRRLVLNHRRELTRQAMLERKPPSHRHPLPAPNVRTLRFSTEVVFCDCPEHVLAKPRFSQRMERHEKAGRFFSPPQHGEIGRDPHRMRHDRPRQHNEAYKKTRLFFQFSLCSYRACLGKLIIFSINWRKGRVFLPFSSVACPGVDRGPPSSLPSLHPPPRLPAARSPPAAPPPPAPPLTSLLPTSASPPPPEEEAEEEDSCCIFWESLRSCSAMAARFFAR